MCLRRRDNWNQLLDDEERGGTLVPIFMLAHQHDSDPELRPPPISRKQRNKILTHLAAGLPVVYEYFKSERRAHAKAETRVLVQHSCMHCR
jgi:uncharacterized protein